jgi:hypothetical protein
MVSRRDRGTLLHRDVSAPSERRATFFHLRR